MAHSLAVVRPLCVYERRAFDTSDRRRTSVCVWNERVSEKAIVPDDVSERGTSSPAGGKDGTNSEYVCRGGGTREKSCSFRKKTRPDRISKETLSLGADETDVATIFVLGAFCPGDAFTAVSVVIYLRPFYNRFDFLNIYYPESGRGGRTLYTETRSVEPRGWGARDRIAGGGRGTGVRGVLDG